MSEERKIINYTVACVSEFAKKQEMNIKEAFRYLFEHKGIAFIKDNYDIEHTLSFDDVISDLSEVCRQNGGIL